jgi:hypothetical protein
MLYAFALAALAAVPAQGGQLKLTNVRMTVGDLGPIRSDAKFLPGDALHLRFDINGLPVEAKGEAKFKMETRVIDKAGKVIFQKDPEERIQLAPLRGNAIPAAVLILIGLDQDPGNYVLEVIVEDPKAKSKEPMKEKVSVNFEVIKRDFGIVCVHTTTDPHGMISSPNIGAVGQTFFVWYSVASFERDPKTKQPKVEIQYQFLDEKRNPVVPEPYKDVQDGGVDEKFGMFSLPFAIFLNRPGKFTFQITATDKVSNKKSTYEYPLTILPQN